MLHFYFCFIFASIIIKSKYTMKSMLLKLLLFCAFFGAFSCSSKLQDEKGMGNIDVEEMLQAKASFHNLGLEYIKSDIIKKSQTYTTTQQIDSMFANFVVYQYGEHKGTEVLRRINSVRHFVVNGNVPSLKDSRTNVINSYANVSNNLAKEALTKCMNDVTKYIYKSKKKNILDNKELLNNIHTIIKRYSKMYIEKCDSEEDVNKITNTLGVLYGSIEYWLNSKNVGYWTNIKIKDNKATRHIESDDAPTNERVRTDTLSESEWISTVVGADAVGSLYGAGVASGASALICSAVIAIHFDVE